MEYTFNYKSAGANGVRFLIVAIIMGAAGAYLAASGIRLRYRGVSLSPEHSSWVGYALLAFALVFLVVGVVALVRGPRPRYVIVGPQRLVVPKSELSTRTVAIDPRSISRVKVHSQGNNSRAVISYQGGKVSVLSSYFAAYGAFEEFLGLLDSARAGALQG